MGGKGNDGSPKGAHFFYPGASISSLLFGGSGLEWWPYPMDGGLYL